MFHAVLFAMLSMQLPADAATEAEVTEFLSALPEYDTLDQPATEDAATAQQRALSEKEHPRQVEAVRQLYRGFTQCMGTVQKDAVRRSLRGTALKLTSDQRRRLTVFYKSADYQRLTAVTAGGKASDASIKPVLDDLAARYPLNEFYAATKEVATDMEQLELTFGGFERCDLERRKGLDRLAG